MQPLKGLTVVTLEHAIAAPFATRQLELLPHHPAPHNSTAE
jgi:crotonobetainyl-CoA:carnitine CoA-transferase CaiB-like acyl-CoA transferase